MQPLIDGDILRYEIGFAAEAGWQEAGFPPFDYVANLLHMRVDNICGVVEATEKPIIYFTGKTNFRTNIKKSFLYKERKSNKPWHFQNLTAYMNAVYNVQLVEGLEADDLMSIEQTKRIDETIICTRDKDLRQVPGWHYSWELGVQPQIGPYFVEGMGSISLTDDRKKIKGWGDMFFYSQCLTGDDVDTVPGLSKCGPVKAFEILQGSESSLEAFNRVLEAYRGVYEDFAEERLLENGQCLWMTRVLNEDGSPKLWEFPNV